LAKILVSDDDPQVLRLVSLCLENAGHEVVSVADACEVAKLAAQTSLDAIVLDVMMAPISGFDVLNELRSNPATASIPVLFLSGRAEGEDRVRGLKEGADDYLAKPFEPEELELRIERLISWSGRAAASSAVPEAAKDGRYMGRYEVQEVIGQGTMGTVYRGWDPRLRRSVAIKTIRLDSIITASQHQQMLDRLRNEAVTVARFNHPNIVAVYDMGDAEDTRMDDTAFMTMEYIDGFSLSKYLKRVGALPTPRLIPLALGMARGLAAAHERLVIHRDVKPGNVLLGRDGGIKVSDFGVAHIVSKASDEVKQLYGTPGYVPPEALRDEPYTQAGDLFGLGATIFLAAAGIHPITGASLPETIRRTREGKVRSLTELKPELSLEFRQLVMALLHPQAAERPPAATAVEILERAAGAGNFSWKAPDFSGFDDP
jgi:CheY-like chemotaxis protein